MIQLENGSSGGVPFRGEAIGKKLLKDEWVIHISFIRYLLNSSDHSGIRYISVQYKI
jgi:hypothetical protein